MYLPIEIGPVVVANVITSLEHDVIRSHHFLKRLERPLPLRVGRYLLEIAEELYQEVGSRFVGTDEGSYFLID